MDLKQYFAETEGFGVLSTADQSGNVDSAVFSRPHFLENDTLAFIMNDRLSHRNLQANPKAAYLFKAAGQGYNGKRLFLAKVKEEKNSELISSLQRRTYPPEKEYNGPKFLVYFTVEKELPLIGPEEAND